MVLVLTHAQHFPHDFHINQFAFNQNMFTKKYKGYFKPPLYKKKMTLFIYMKNGMTFKLNKYAYVSLEKIMNNIEYHKFWKCLSSL